MRHALVFAGLISLMGCDGLFNKKPEREALARVGEQFLYKDDVAPLLAEDMTAEDSISFVNNFINQWATDRLLLGKAKINLPENKLEEFDNLVENYRTDLYTRAYKEALVIKGTDSVISEEQVRAYYDVEKENFKLKERIARLRFVQLPLNFLNQEEVSERLRRFEAEDRRYLDSIGVQFNKLNFNDSIWVRASRVMEEIPPITYDNLDRYLKNSQFFELQDSLGVYLVKVEETKDLNGIAPLSFVVPRVRQILLNRRRLDYLRKLEAEIKDEAIKDKEFQIFDNEN
ncbi:peptidyl-prolyl cis-trans isomerase [Maribacter sp. 2307ULW6-5]|uniref:peptidyl-prolyl cis-trans isomerase n=1 Tax=Maribacter sp. 2307ULW6-5 TaxID=3386275 RepID=UPI0039BCD479